MKQRKANPGIPAMTKQHSRGLLLCVSSNNDLLDVTGFRREKESSPHKVLVVGSKMHGNEV